jgi:hypothetical protein
MATPSVAARLELRFSEKRFGRATQADFSVRPFPHRPTTTIVNSGL